MWRLLFLVLVQHLVAVHCKGLTLSPPRAPWPSSCPRQGSRPLRFCGLQTPHQRGQSVQKPQVWGFQLGEGTSILLFLPAGSRLLSG